QGYLGLYSLLVYRAHLIHLQAEYNTRRRALQPEINEDTPPKRGASVPPCGLA
ncbi:hypothetical protein LCGC14_1699760, partial [marine sediment metagenome]